MTEKGLVSIETLACKAIAEVKALQNRIKELEEAMKPKACDGCEYLHGAICKHDRGLYCLRQFEADYFKPKDNA